MSNSPYIQTVQGFDDEIKDYAIAAQPVERNDDEVPTEENPILAFGPLGRINIFVGATNAGKSRFLRTLLKCNQYQFLTMQMHQKMTAFVNLAWWLSEADGVLVFKIDQERNHASREPAAFSGMADWVKVALAGIKSGESFEVTFDRTYFQSVVNELEEFLSGRFTIKDGQKTTTALSTPDADKGVWAKNILIGEEEALIADEKVTPHAKFHLPNISSIQNRKERMLLPAINWQFENGQFKGTSQQWKDNFLAFWEAYDFLRQTDACKYDMPRERIYIPTLRSAISLKDKNGERLTTDIFAETVRRNYKMEKTGIKIFTGTQLYDTMAKDIRASWQLHDRFADFEKFLGDAFYDGRRVRLLALSKNEEEASDEHISVRVEGQTPRELHDLGDGINTLIILLYRVFMAEAGSWIFIEEPELNLHPGLQRVFLQTLLENEVLENKSLRVFFTTHSNHLLRMTLRDGTIATEHISIFAFQQRETNKNRFLIRPLVSEHHTALALLGVQNASVLMAQCGVWVEGVTDRKYIRAYLKAFMESSEWKGVTLREDIHFAFWEYAGSNLSHYLFDEETEGQEILGDIRASALCNRIFLVADQDNSKWKDERHEKLESLAKERENLAYFKTPGREIENLLSTSQLKECLPVLFGLKPENVPTVAFEDGDFLDVSMGKFLKESYGATCPDALPLKNQKGELGTLSNYYKNKLADEAVKHITWDTMSEGAKDLARKLYDFLEKHNSI